MAHNGINVIGIVGVGEIGSRMGSLLLAAGYRVMGYDVSTQAAANAKDRGFEIADNLAALCHRSDLVITCVTDGGSLREVISGPGGIARNFDTGKILIDTTSAEPWITRELAPLLQEKAIQFLDAPVSGGVPAADAGKLNFMVGGDAALLDRCRAVLSRLGPVITHVGDVGRGHTLKAINMPALASSMLATGELIAVARSAGYVLDEVVTSLNAGIGGSFSTRVHFPRFIAPGNYSSGFTFDLMIKDLSIGIGLAERANIPLFLQRSAYEFYRVAANTGLRGKDNTRIVQRLMEHKAVPPPTRRSGDFLDRLAVVAAGCNIIVAAESVSLGAALGIAPATIIEVLSASSGDSYPLSHWLAAYLRGEAAAGAPALDEIWESLSQVMPIAMAARVPTPLLNQAAAIYAAAMADRHAATDGRGVVRMIARCTGQADAVEKLGRGGKA